MVYWFTVLNQFGAMCDVFAGSQMTGAGSDWELPLQFWKQRNCGVELNCGVEPT